MDRSSDAAEIHPRTSCPNCKFISGAEFCSACGEWLEAPREGLLPIASHEILGGVPGQGFFATLTKLLRRPVKGTLELVENPLYRGHGSFLIAATTIYTMAMGWVIGRQSAELGALAKKSGWHASATTVLDSFFTVLRNVIFPFYLYFALATIGLLGYWVFSRLSPRNVEPRKYVRLTSLAWGFTLLLMTIANIGYYVTLPEVLPQPKTKIAAVATAAYQQLDLAIYFLAALIGLAVLIYVFMVNKRFWQIGFWKMLMGFTGVALGATLAAALVSALLLAVTVPILMSLI